MLKRILRGTGVAVVTPFDKSNNIDFVALEKLLSYIVEGGVNYWVLLGTTAESVTLDTAEKRDIIQFCVEKNTSKVPIVIGIGGNDTKVVEQQLAKLPLESSVAVMSVSPYYNRPSQEGIFQHYKHLAASTSKPLIMYNVPSRTGKSIDPQTVVRLANEVSNIQGIKEASPTIDNALLLLKDCPHDFFIASGEDSLALPLLLLGVDSLISVAANAFPDVMSKMVAFALNGNRDAAKEEYFYVFEAIKLMFEENNPAGVKAFLAEKKIIQNYLRLPLVPVSASLQQRIAQVSSCKK